MAPHLNPICERFIRSIKSECLNRTLIFGGERHLEYLVYQFVKHYYTERPHQGLDNTVIARDRRFF
ncbi:MAG: integrase core domain-containing protein [Planctomycetota bacterium]|jgi:transposase InsO family protein